MKEIFALKNKDGKLLFGYRTFQGNVKKAFFNSKKLAEEALKIYIEPSDKFRTGIKGLKIIKIGESIN